MLFNKETIKHNFSKKAFSYEKQAALQKNAAKNLVEKISPFLRARLESRCDELKIADLRASKRKCTFEVHAHRSTTNQLFASHRSRDYKRVLDLGSGTGFVAREILQKNKDLEIYETDLCCEMLNLWQDRPKNVKTHICDIENLPFAFDSFDIITSSFALHWLNDFEKSFTNFCKILKPNGILAFCLPTKNSLKELRALKIFQINDFPEIEFIKKIAQKNSLQELDFTSENVVEEFTNPLAAIKFIKNIGANYHKKTSSLKKEELKQIRNFHLKNESAVNKKFSISWESSLFIYRKS